MSTGTHVTYVYWFNRLYGKSIHTFLSFLYQVNVASGLPPEDTHNSFCTDPAGIIDPSTYPEIIGGDGGSKTMKKKKN